MNKPNSSGQKPFLAGLPQRPKHMCRLCLAQHGAMINMFDNENKNIHVALVDCMGLKISQGDGLPELICQTCLRELIVTLKFQKACLLSHLGGEP